MAGVRLALAAFALLGLTSPVLAQVPCAAPAPADCVITTSVTVPTGTEWDVGPRALIIAASKTVTVQSLGYFTIRAASITLQSAAKIIANGTDGYGGLVNLEATGDVELQSLSRIDVSANDAAGVITIAANGGSLVSQGQLRAQASSKVASGGFVTLLGDDAVMIDGEGIDVTGGSMADGGYVEMYSSGAITVTAPLNASGGEYGAGEVDIDAEGSVSTSSGGLIDVQARNGSGSGGSVLVSSRLGVSLGGGIVGVGSAGGSDGDGYGAEVEVYAETGDVAITAPLDLRGGGNNGFGGLLTINAGGAIAVGQVLASSKANGFGRGGEVEVNAGASFDLGSTIDVRGGIVGGSLTGVAGTTATVTGTILASGTTVLPPATSSRAGLVTIAACTIDLPSGSVLTNLGSADPERGINRLRASSAMTVGGTMSAGTANVIEWRDQPPTLSGVVTPAAQVVQNVDLPCCVDCTTTTTTSTTTSSTTSTSTTTTTTSTVPETTTTTSTTVPETTTSSSTVPPTITTTTTTTTTSSTVLDSTTTSSTVVPTTTTIAPSTTSTRRPPLPTTTSTTVPVACVDLPLAGFDAVDCRLDAINGVLASESVDTLGGKKWAVRLDKAVARARTAVAVARTGRRVTPNLRRANKQLRTFVRAVAHAQANGMPAILGSHLTALASGATNEIGALRSAQQ